MNNLISKEIDFKEKKVSTLDSREVAEMLGKEHSYVLEMIQGREGKLGIIPVLENANLAVSNYFVPSTYKAGTREYKCYLVTKMGCELLGNKQQGEKGILFTAKYVEAFNKMEEHIKGQSLNTSELSPELQMFNQMFKAMANNELETKEAKRIALNANNKAEEVKEEIQSIRDVITLDSNGWRKETATLINKIANKFGGFEHIRNVREESYKLLNETYGVDINRRLKNKQKNMALEGVSRSKINKVNLLDVIAEDKKLLNGYISIVTKMAIRYGVA